MIPNLHSGPFFANRRVGLFGGSFNPAHEGHVLMSLHALKRLRLDHVWWLVSPQNPMKPVNGMASLEERLKQARALTRGYPQLAVTAIEACLGTRYTVDTIERLRMRMPKVHFVWLMGMDNLQQIDRWQRWETLFESVPIAVFRRPGYARRAGCKAVQRFAKFQQHLRAAKYLAEMMPPAWLVLDNHPCALSATSLRQQKAPNA